MAKALIRICVNIGKEQEVRDNLRAHEDVLLAEITAGEQDVIAIVKSDTFEKILKLVMERIRLLDGIKITWTNFILD